MLTLHCAGAYIIFNFAVVFACTWLYLGGLRKIKGFFSMKARCNNQETKKADRNVQTAAHEHGKEKETEAPMNTQKTRKEDWNGELASNEHEKEKEKETEARTRRGDAV